MCLKMNRSISDLVFTDVRLMCDFMANTACDNTDLTDTLLDIWSGEQILYMIHIPQFPIKPLTWLKNIE